MSFPRWGCSWTTVGRTLPISELKGKKQTLTGPQSAGTSRIKDNRNERNSQEQWKHGLPHHVHSARACPCRSGWKSVIAHGKIIKNFNIATIKSIITSLSLSSLAWSTREQREAKLQQSAENGICWSSISSGAVWLPGSQNHSWAFSLQTHRSLTAGVQRLI